MNKIASLSVIASLALLAIPSNTAFASELKSKSLRVHHQNAWTKTIAFRNDGSDRMLNPQPLPPGPPQEKFTTYKTNPALNSAITNRRNLAALNPQPLPPGPPQEKLTAYKTNRALTTSFANRGNLAALNPQPLPPGPPQEKFKTIAFKTNGSDRMLNPQPLPPGPPQERLNSSVVNRISTVSFTAPQLAARVR
jgi:hypothetical protein